MTPRTLIRLTIVLVTTLAAAPACAQLYRWVDERGVTNYSDQPPADPKAAKKLAPVGDRISIYTPDKAFMQAVEAFRQKSTQASAERIASLERELEAERWARQRAAAAAAQAAYDSCLSQGINCNGTYSSSYPYDPGFGFVTARHPLRRINQIQLPPGTTAGNVVGANGFIPGNSAFAPARSVLPSRALLEAPTRRSFATR